MRTRLILITGAAAWCSLIIAAPILAAGDGAVRSAGVALTCFFSPVCHQWDSHSFHLCGEKLPVCIRCSAIYFGFLCGIILFPTFGAWVERRFSSRAILSAAAGGMLLDVLLSLSGISDSTIATRLLTGGTFGLLTAFVLTPLLQELIESISAGAV